VAEPLQGELDIRRGVRTRRSNNEHERGNVKQVRSQKIQGHSSPWIFTVPGFAALLGLVALFCLDDDTVLVGLVDLFTYPLDLDDV
jgi:hypothetical protein